ncbi:MAG: hypothetical protein JSV52_12205 [Candidatus Zixiibacteriota bacterium]|nr:MAG: hypothetical protein JSV52_12205 [candidate division Zixibacteria bacterium]
MLSTIRVPILLILLFGCLIFALTGCSSTDVLDAGSTVSAQPADAGTLKVTITSNNNAAQPETQIEFSVPESGPVFIEITNATGYHIRTLLDRSMEAGTYYVVWDGLNENGDEVNPSIYLFHIEASDREAWYPFAVNIMPNNLPD